MDKPEPRWENARRAAEKKYHAGDPYWQNVFPAIFTPANKARYERAKQFAADFNAEHGTHYTLDQLLNAYALAHARTDLLAVGPITIDQLRRTVGSLRLSRLLEQDDVDYLYRGD